METGHHKLVWAKMQYLCSLSLEIDSEIILFL